MKLCEDDIQVVSNSGHYIRIIMYFKVMFIAGQKFYLVKCSTGSLLDYPLLKKYFDK